VVRFKSQFFVLDKSKSIPISTGLDIYALPERKSIMSCHLTPSSTRTNYLPKQRGCQTRQLEYLMIGVLKVTSNLRGAMSVNFSFFQ